MMENPDQPAMLETLEVLTEAKRQTLAKLLELAASYGGARIEKSLPSKEIISITGICGDETEPTTWLDIPEYGIHTTLEAHLETTTFERLGALLDHYEKLIRDKEETITLAQAG